MCVFSGRLAGDPRIGAPTNKQPDPADAHSFSHNNTNHSHVAGGGSSVAGTADHSHTHTNTNTNSVLYKPATEATTSFNPTTFGANSGIKNPTTNQAHSFPLDESPTAGPTATSTAEGTNPASSYVDPLASLLDTEFSYNLGGPSAVSGSHHAAGVGYHSNSVVTDTPGIPKHQKMSSLVNNGSFNAGHNYSIDEDKSYNNSNNHSGKNNLSGGQAAFDSYLGGGDNRCVDYVLSLCPIVVLHCASCASLLISF